ncbi:hypothetical protein O3M35_005984 [Rhynocoris fuscipes]
MNLSSFERMPAMDLHQNTPGTPPTQRHIDSVFDTADKMLEKFIQEDGMFPQLIDKMRITCESGGTVSGLDEIDYPCPATLPSLMSIIQLKIINKIPIPPEILEQCGNMISEVEMGLFTSINRAWLAFNSDIYMWNYETGGDVAYFDSLNETICAVGMVPPKHDVFQPYIQQLLVLATIKEVVVMGVTIAETPDKRVGGELQLTNDVLYSIQCENVTFTVIKGTASGRIFLGGSDGNLYELIYQKQTSWWGRRCKLVNQSRGTLSYLWVPYFFADDPVAQIVVDPSRHILYVLTNSGGIDVYDLGSKGNSVYKVASMSQKTITSQCLNIVKPFQHARMFDISDFAKIVALCPLEEFDSAHFGVVGVTETGVRLYFSTGSPPPHRPSCLQLLHVRFPPGYTSSSVVFRYDQLTKAVHKSGTFVMATTNRENCQDKIWCISSDAYPVKPALFTEDAQCHLLTAPVVSIGELNTNSVSSDNCFPTENGLVGGNLLVYQQNYPPEKFVVLTHQGAEIYEKLRPVDILAEIMRDRNGPDCEEVKKYFNDFGTDQACAMALILACNNLMTNTQMAEWATRAFFLYGGDPRHAIQHLPQQSLFQYSLPQGFKPGTVSTPLGDKNPMSPITRQVEAFTVEMSSKHNGLYLYLARIVRQIWLKKLVMKTLLDDGNEYYVSVVSVEQLVAKTTQLYGLKAFLEKTTIQNGTQEIQGYQDREMTLSSPSGMRARVQEAISQEKASLDGLKSLVDHTAQVLGLWKILCEHQLHILTLDLSKEHKEQLQLFKFRELILYGRELCGVLIARLINLYLDDQANVDSISAKLREVCPTLYRSEDAACSKINEILLKAKDERDDEQKLLQLRQAVKMCKEVSPHINLSSVCKQLTCCKYYDGVLEVCQDFADKLDPHNLAQKFLDHGQPLDDTPGSNAYHTRLNTYREVSALLDELYNQYGGPHTSMMNTSFNFVDGSPNKTAGVSSPQQKIGSSSVLESVLIKCLAVEDETCHMVVYDWLTSRNLHTSLVTLGRPSVEKYLTRPGADTPANLDLLWQYHQRSGQHAHAAQVLYKLATTPRDSVKLYQRLSYLGKAVMCMRSDGVGCAPHLGVFLHELEDLVQVARVQKQVLDRIAANPQHERSEEMCRKLNSELMSITELYEDFAEPLRLWDCILTILDCAGHDDKMLIHSVWDNILTEELSQCAQQSNEDQMAIVISKVRDLGRQFTTNSPCFPIAYLVMQLEQISCELEVVKSHVHQLMIQLGVSVQKLLDIYDQIFTANYRCWMAKGNELHLIQVIANFADTFAENKDQVPINERKAVAIQMQDLITNCLSTLYSKPNSNQLIAYLKTLQAKLASMV